LPELGCCKRIAGQSDLWCSRRRAGSGGQAVDVGLTVAVAANELGAQFVEAVEAQPTVGRHADLERSDRVGEHDECGVVERLQAPKALAGSDLIELDGQRMATEILGRPATEKPFLLLVVGYPADGAKVPAAVLNKKPLDEIATFL